MYDKSPEEEILTQLAIFLAIAIVGTVIILAWGISTDPELAVEVNTLLGH